ncbi:MAG TPA: chitobiase/beta-hexosaminidase C-terminal domain-containing protein [Steroidobacteraceae bacterium]|nr:chitobiase/beta-hexosaminidase C-terminal domain-containing protein [Steroidobacteraceae bacterium]
MKRRKSTAAGKIGFASMLVAALLGCSRSAPHGLTTRTETPPYLRMPAHLDGQIPALLSQTGVFSDTARRIANPGLIPYDLNVAFWSDGADKLRWIAIPEGRIAFSPTGEWRFPPGTVFVKNFDLGVDDANPSAKRRLETRLLVRDADGGVYGVVYKWRPDGSDADLLAGSETETIPIKSATGEVRRQTWYYPSRQDCLTCHTANAGGVLGVKTRQLNRSFAYPSGVSDNELRAWNHLGLFTPAVKEDAVRALAALAATDDASRTLQDRSRSYLDANCSQCHRPGGTVANFDARYDTPLADQALIDGPVLIDQGIDRPRVIAAHDIWRSIAYMRVDTDGDIKMPPLARETIDHRGVALLGEWINSLPGPAVLAPPTVVPVSGTYTGPVQVSMSVKEPGAEIRYTLDGSVPEVTDLRYERPIKLAAPTVLRARAFKQGFTRSITVQEVFVIGK